MNKIKYSPGEGRRSEQTTALEYLAGSFWLVEKIWPQAHKNEGSIKDLNVLKLKKCL